MAEKKTPKTGQEAREKIIELVKDMNICMMATHSSEGFLHSRPMGARLEEKSGDIWFFTTRGGPVVAEIRANPEVLLNYSEPSDQTYVSISGRGSIVDDRAKAKELWTEPMSTWFPKGVDDPDLILIKVDGERGQYWDSPSSAVVYAYGYLKAKLTGERPNPGEEGKARL